VVQAAPAPPTQVATFTAGALTQGPAKVVSFDLSATQSTFVGTLNFMSNTSGFAFQYQFSGPANGSQLQIYVNGNPYASFIISDIAATWLPGSGSFVATIPVGYEATFSSTAKVTFALQPPPGATATSQVRLSGFQTFSRPGS
jgi:hypothetical protein